MTAILVTKAVYINDKSGTVFTYGKCVFDHYWIIGLVDGEYNSSWLFMRYVVRRCSS